MAKGPLTEKVLEYVETMTRVVPSATSVEDFAPIAEYLAVDEYERVGTFLEEQDWPAYADMLLQWASGIDSFESHTRRISEVDNLVFYETEERHFKGDASGILNSLTVFEFDDDRRIRRMDVFMQKAP